MTISRRQGTSPILSCGTRLAPGHGVLEHIASMTPLKRGLIFAAIAWSAVTALRAAEHHGSVTFHGLPIPGAVVTAIQGDRKLTTSTDEDGTYSFCDLPDGIWSMEVEIAGFAKASREIGVAPAAPVPTWDLKLAPPMAAPAPPPPGTLAGRAGAPPAGPGSPGPSGAPGGRGGAPSGPGGPAPGAGRGGPPMTPAQAQAAARARMTAQFQAQDSAQSRAAAVAATTASTGGGDALVLAGSVGGGGGGGASFGNSLAGSSQYNGNVSFSLDNSVRDAECEGEGLVGEAGAGEEETDVAVGAANAREQTVSAEGLKVVGVVSLAGSIEGLEQREGRLAGIGADHEAGDRAGQTQAAGGY
jgi:hypothetical protein